MATGDLILESFPPSRAVLDRPPAAPARPQYQEALDSQVRPWAEVRPWAPQTGIRAVIVDTPGPMGPAQEPWALYAEVIPATVPDSWAPDGEDCSCE